MNKVRFLGSPNGDEKKFAKRSEMMYEYERVIEAALGDSMGEVTATEVEKEMRQVHKHGLDKLKVHDFIKACKQALTRVVAKKGMDDE